MIDETKLIEEIQLIAKELNKDKQNAEPDDSDLILAVDNQLSAIWRIKGVINNQPQVQQWIPCSERLPEDLNDKNIDCFLVTDGFLIWMAYYNSKIGWQFAECTNSRNKIDWTEIIAWQPLPSVWKGENNAEK